MPDQTTPPEAAAASAGDPLAAVREELAAANEEILRLRGRLVEINTELGTVRGQLTALEARSRRLTGIALGLWMRIPILNRLPHLVHSLFQRLRG
jgi:hypothetical protein